MTYYNDPPVETVESLRAERDAAVARAEKWKAMCREFADVQYERIPSFGIVLVVDANGLDAVGERYRAMEEAERQLTTPELDAEIRGRMLAAIRAAESHRRTVERSREFFVGTGFIPPHIAPIDVPMADLRSLAEKESK